MDRPSVDVPRTPTPTLRSTYLAQDTPVQERHYAHYNTRPGPRGNLHRNLLRDLDGVAHNHGEAMDVHPFVRATAVSPRNPRQREYSLVERAVPGRQNTFDFGSGHAAPATCTHMDTDSRFLDPRDPAPTPSPTPPPKDRPRAPTPIPIVRTADLLRPPHALAARPRPRPSMPHSVHASEASPYTAATGFGVTGRTATVYNANPQRGGVPLPPPRPDTTPTPQGELSTSPRTSKWWTVVYAASEPFLRVVLCVAATVVLGASLAMQDAGTSNPASGDATLL